MLFPNYVDNIGKRSTGSFRSGGGRRPLHPTPQIVGKIVPLMSINAEAPPSFVNNPNFLDSPPASSPQTPPPPEAASAAAQKSSAKKESVKVEGEKSEQQHNSNGGEVEVSCPGAGSSADSNEDGFQEVKSKSARRQQKAKQQQQQKIQKASSSLSASVERSSSGKSKRYAVLWFCLYSMYPLSGIVWQI